MKKMNTENTWALALVFLVLVTPMQGVALAGYVTTTDYSIFGSIRHFEEASPFSVSGDLASIPGDAMGRQYNGLIYIVGRGGSNIVQIFNPEAGFNLVGEFSLGTGLNLQDIALIDASTAYVSCYDEAVLLKVDLDNGLVLDTFSTASFADSDGLPETAMMRYHDHHLYITCQLLDRAAWYAPTGPSDLLVFDTDNEQWVDMDPATAGIQPISLQGANPYTDLILEQETGSDTTLLLGCVGNYGMTDGGIERVNLATGLSEGFVVTEADLGGDLTRLAQGPGGLFAIVADGAFNTGMKFINGTSGLVSLIDQGVGYNYSDLIALGDGLLFLADRTPESSGIRVFDALSFAELTTDPISTGLPPFQFVLDLTTEGATPVLPDLAGTLHVGQPFPNPCNPTAILNVNGPAGTPVAVKVIDMRGRCLQSGTLNLDGNGTAVFRFSGTDRMGRAMAAGQYRIIFEDGQGWAARSVTLIK